MRGHACAVQCCLAPRLFLSLCPLVTASRIGLLVVACCQAGYDRHITIFSPEGRLYQIEYAFKAVKAGGLTSVGMKGKGCVALVTQKKVPDKLVDPVSVTHIFKITNKVGCVMTGLSADAKALVRKAREEASEYRFQNGYDMPCHVLAKRLADLAQVWTQQAGKRAMGAEMILCSVDEEKGAQLFKCDPSGTFFGYKATAAGEKEAEAKSFFEKKFKEEPEGGDTAYTVQAAIMCLQSVLSSDFKPEELEVGLAEGTERFRTLDVAEIEAHLTAIAERD